MPTPSSSSSASSGRWLGWYRQMLLIRRVEERIVTQYAEQDAVYARRGVPAHTIKCPTHLSIGQEAAAVGLCDALGTDDVAFSTHRCHAHYLAKGGSLPAMMAELFGRVAGCSRGKGGSMHLVDPSVGMMGASAIVGGTIPLATGAALAFQLRREPRVAVAFFGDGAVEEGVFHEGLNVASLRKLPVVFACENNFYATLSHISSRQSAPIAQHAASYGAVGVALDGDDVSQVAAVAHQAVARARQGGGPTLIEVRAYRWMPHVGTTPDTGKMRRSAEELAEWMARCPVAFARRRLVAAGVPEADIAAVEAQVDTQIEDAVAFAHASPEPLPDEIVQHVGAGAQT
jgi:acetoin:2,6-dichlorophenolindophenol oxidoreductase subunit alpha